jgi:hypothetical protein
VKITTQWFNADTLQCLSQDEEGDFLVGEAFWNGTEWIFFCYTRDGAIDHAAGQMYIGVDPLTEAAMRDEEQEILVAHAERPTERDVKLMELAGRRRMFRDDEEHHDTLRVRAVELARRYLRDGTLKKGGE